MNKQVVGINIGHNSSAVLIINNENILRLEEEKLTQLKGHFGFPSLAIANIFQMIDPKVSLQVIIGHKNIYEIFSTHRLLIKFCKLESKTEYFYLIFDLYKFIFPRTTLLRSTIKHHFEKNLIRKSSFFKNLDYVDHHDSHAWSAIFDSGFNDCLVLTRDGKGDFFSGKDYIYENDSLKSIVSYQFLQSYGLVYSAATKALGFKMLRHEGKLTGLAAFGNPNLLSEKIYQYYKTLFLSKFQISDKYKGNFKFKNIIRKRFTDKLVIKYSNLLSNWVVFFESLIKDGFTYKDIAAGVQDFLEKMVLIEIDELKKNYSLPKNIVLAGGIFANVKLNQKIWELGYFEKMFVQPAMDDAGTALGAAATKSKKKSLEPTLRNTVYLGSDKLEANLNDLPLIFSKSIISVSEIGTLIHNYLSAGKIIGYYQGRTEWGPRALGNRSILASAFNNDIPSKLNMRLKRNDFMPFAPIVRDIDAFKLFENYSTGLLASKFMTVTLTVRNQYKNLIPSVIHVDSTARPQILFKEDNQPLYEILNEVAVYHEIGIVLNTSFNLHEFPILDSFQTALDNLEKGAVDLLVVNGQLLISLKN